LIGRGPSFLVCKSEDEKKKEIRKQKQRSEKWKKYESDILGILFFVTLCFFLVLGRQLVYHPSPLLLFLCVQGGIIFLFDELCHGGTFSFLVFRERIGQ